jgi:hypothetical protein
MVGVMLAKVGSSPSIPWRVRLFASCTPQRYPPRQGHAHLTRRVPPARGADRIILGREKSALQMMHLRVLTQHESIPFADRGCNALPLPRWSSTSTAHSFRFHAVLTESGDPQIEVVESRKLRTISPYTYSLVQIWARSSRVSGSSSTGRSGQNRCVGPEILSPLRLPSELG